MHLGEYINEKIQDTELTKQFISSELGISRQGFDQKLKSGKFDVNEYLRLSRIIGFEPNYYFTLLGYEIKEIDINQVNEPQVEYRSIKNYKNKKMINTPDTDRQRTRYI